MISDLFHIVLLPESVLKSLKERYIGKLLLITVSIALLFTSRANAQTGPGGVGNSASNRLWLKADAGVYRDAGVTPAANTDDVYRWNDFSGNNNHASQPDGVHNPVYRTNIVNNSPALKFNGDEYIDPLALGIAGNQGFSIITVFKVDSYSAGGISEGNGDYIIDRAALQIILQA